MKSSNQEPVNCGFSWRRTGRWLFGMQTVLLAFGLLGIMLTTAASAADLVSVNRGGTDSGNGASDYPKFSADGRLVVFSSKASDLVDTDTNGAQDIFVRDLASGTTTLVSVNRTGTDSGNSGTGSFDISANGRFVVFKSKASDLIAADTDGTWNIFVRDLVGGTTTLVSINRDGTASCNSGTGSFDISADGRFVVFESDASDLVDTDTNYDWDIYVRDLENGTTTLVSLNREGTDAGNSTSMEPQISADGRFVAFISMAGDLVAMDTNWNWNIYVRDLENGTTTLASVNHEGTASGSGNSGCDSPISAPFKHTRMISADGRFVVFESDANDLVATDTNRTWDIFVRDLVEGTTTLVSVNREGTDAGNYDSSYSEISADGRFVSFASEADDLVATDTNGERDVFVRDLVKGTTTLVSVNRAGTDSCSDGAFGPEISADGRRVAFMSSGSDLVAADTNGVSDVFVYKTPSICDCADPGAIKGTDGPDVLFGTAGADIICGLGGNDMIIGLDGDDCIDGGDGNDWISGGKGLDILFGGDGHDILFDGGGGDDMLDGGEGNDWGFGGPGTDKCSGEVLIGCENQARD